ncbi:hypothetical protein JTB14_004075 [Gonioctena quinquepunctata]|nr:hypothetical protein JTB14_004075 [Gonioctena quinquepunctata]
MPLASQKDKTGENSFNNEIEEMSKNDLSPKYLKILDTSHITLGSAETVSELEIAKQEIEKLDIHHTFHDTKDSGENILEPESGDQQETGNSS